MNNPCEVKGNWTMTLKMAFRWFVMLSLSCVFSPSADAGDLVDKDANEVRVMSFNIRYGTAKDGENHWDHRKDWLTETIRTFEPDLLGTQETLGFQRDFLAAKLPEYDSLGVGREDGGPKGEMMALFYKRDRFEKLAGGHFWLSETPDTIGSKSWDSSLPRMVTWVKLKDRQRPTASPIVFINTHFDHRGPTARLESAKLLRSKVRAFAQGSATIITGDFNTGAGSPPYQALFGPLEDQPSVVVDTFRVIHPQQSAEEGTATGFQASATGGSRIDWIGVSRDWEIRSATIDRTSKSGRTPSDHFPVTAVLHGK
jgi:endonuclease/exonuclease/phosphatase family metal-dependent hydrolase